MGSIDWGHIIQFIWMILFTALILNVVRANIADGIVIVKKRATEPDYWIIELVGLMAQTFAFFASFVIAYLMLH